MSQHGDGGQRASEQLPERSWTCVVVEPQAGHAAPPKARRRGGSGARRIVPSRPHGNSAPNPSVPFVLKISGRPCVPGVLLEEPGTSGPPAAQDCLIVPSTSYTLRAGGLMKMSFLRWWAAQPRFPPTQGLPGLFLSKGTDASEREAPVAGTRRIRLTPEPPLLFFPLL